MKAILIGCFLMCATLAMSQNKEVLLVQQIAVGIKVSGIYLFWEGKEPEKVEVKDPDFITQTQALALVFQRLYKEGWSVVAAIGQGNSGQYVLERAKD
jgi:hypothetical protein